MSAGGIEVYTSQSIVSTHKTLYIPIYTVKSMFYSVITYKSFYNIAVTYLCELISRRESYVNTRLGADHH